MKPEFNKTSMHGGICCDASSWNLRLHWFLCIAVFLGMLTVSQPATAALVCSSPGKDGTGTPSGVVNTYFPGSASASAGATSISLGASSGAATAIASGDLLLVIQMQDADINSSNSSSYGSGTGTGAGYTSLNQAGLYEFVKATNAVGTGGGTVTLATGLSRSYRSRAASAVNGQSTFQVVRVPQYTTATVSGTLSAAPWDGAKGGIVAIDVAGALTINGTVEADGKGFRGGWGESGGSGGGLNTDYVTLDSSLANGTKGEGIAGTPTRMNQPSGFNAAPGQATTGTSPGYPDGANANATKARGAPGNGGGGGTDGDSNGTNDQNSGGGGGGNFSAGGKGGNSWNSNLPVGGEGGAAVPVSNNRIVMGGGGGAGTSNNGTADNTTYTSPAGNACSTADGRCSSGAPGGGLIILRARSITGAGNIYARGGTGYNTLNDSAGGGGGGGSAILQTQLGGYVAVNVSGGDGGNAWRGYSNNTADRHGPGGGGSGGFIAYSPAGLNLSATLNGGLNGKSTNEDSYGAGASSGGLYAYQSPNVPGSQPGYICQPSLSIAKSTTTPVVNASGTATYTITVKNNGVVTASGVSISDLLPGSPALFTNASATPTLTYTPSGCATRISTTDAAVGSSTPAWSLWDITAGCQLDLAFNATVPAGTIPATYQNPASATYNGVTITYNPLSSTAEDVTVRAPVSAVKSFSPASIASGGQSTITVTLTNPNPVAVTSVGFTDTLPATTAGAPGNMTIANPPVPATTCAGSTPTYTAVNGSGSFTISNVTVPANSSCNVSFTVTAVQAGIYVNTIPAGGITGSTGSSTKPATASLTVANTILPPTITKTFLTNPILPGGVTTLSFTLTNPNAATAIGSAGFIDTLPNNITVAATPGITNTCGGASTVTAVAGSASISLNTNGTIPANSSCTVTVNVTGTVPGIYQNTTGQVVGDTGAGNTASATLTIMAPLVVGKTFLTNPVPQATATTLQIVLSNPNNVNATGAAFLDTYPGGLINATPANATVSCTGGGTATLQGGANGGSTVGITAGTITAGNSCTVTVSVQAAAAGLYTNSTGTVTTTNAGTSSAVSAGLNVLAPPKVTKSFSPAQVALNGSTTMTIVVENPAVNTATLTAVVLLDNYPTGMTNMAAGSTPVCTTGGSATLTGGVSGGATVGLTAGTIPAGGFCTITQLVTANQDVTNTTNAPTSTNGGTGATASAFLKFIRPLQVAKSFASSHLARRTSNLMSITITNPNNFDVTGAAFTDTYPTTPGTYLHNAGANGTTYTAPTITGTGCTGTLTGVNNGGSLALTGGTVPANTTCTYAINTEVDTSNVIVSNVTGPVTTTNAGTSLGDTATVSTGTADSPVEISKSFAAPALINVGQTSVLTFTINNPTGGLAKTNIGFVDVLPTGLSAANIGATPACGGTYTVTNGNTITLQNNGTLAAGVSSCTFTVTVTANQPGLMLNHSGQVQYSATPLYGNYADASLMVRYPPTITKSFSDSTIVSGGSTAMTISLGNLNDSALTTSSVLTDTLPTSPGAMTIANSTISNNTCPFTPLDQSGTALSTGDTGFRIPSGASIPAGGCQFTVYVTAAAAGSYTNTITAGALATNAGSNAAAATASLNVVAVPPVVAKTFLPATIAAGGTSTLLITLYNPNSVPIALSSIFTDTFPTGVVTAGTPNRATTCAGGTVGGTSGTLTLSSGASIPPGTTANPGSCTFQVDVTAAASGIYTNTIPTAALSTNAGSNATSAQAVLTVTQSTPPTVSKAFGTTAIAVGGTTTLTLTLTNTNSGNATLSANLDDTLPTIAGPGTLVIATPNGLTGSCPGTVTATAGTQLIRYASGATIPAGGCTIVVNVTSATAGAYTNTIAAGALQTNLGNSPGPTSDTLNVVQASLNKAFSPTTIDQGGISTLTFTLTNGAGNPAQSGINFTDNLPAYVTVAAVPNITTTCPSGTGVVAAAAGSGNIVVTGATMSNAMASCVISVDVTSNTPGGPYNNTSANIVGTAKLTNSVTSSGLTVNAKPTLTKAFSTGTIGVGQTATLTFTVTNPAGAPARSGLTFTDSFPANLVIAAVPNVVNGCGGGATITAAAGTSTFTVGGSGINAAAGASTCTVSVDVTSTTLLSGYVNGAAQITAISNLLLNGVTNQTLNVVQASLNKAFSPTTIDQGGTSTLTFTLTNGAGNPAQSGINFTDNLPTFVTVAAVPNITTTCPSGAGVVTAAAGSGNIVVTGATMSNAMASCAITVDVTSNTPGGPYDNTSANIGGTARLTNSVTSSGLTVNAKPTLTKAFSTGTIGVGQTATLTFTVTNPAGAPARSGLTFTDSFPANLVIAAVPNVVNGCGGGATITAVAGTSNFTVGGSGINAAAGASTCTVKVDVTSTTPFSGYVNGAAQITAISNLLLNGVTNQTLNVVQASLNKAFSPTTIDQGGTSTLTFTLTNGAGNPAQTGINFTDNLPANVTVAAAPNITTTCPSGTGVVAAAAGSGSIVVTGATMSTASCVITVDVTSNTPGGPYNNTSANIAGTARLTNSVTSSGLSVRAKLTLRKTWVNALVNDAVSVTATGLTSLASVANSASETDAGGAQNILFGSVLTLGESFTTGNAANYTSALACTGTNGLAGNTLTVGATDSAIVCTYTNTRKTVNFTLQKTWVNALVGDTVNVTATGLTTLNSVANTANETDAAAVQTVRAGDVITLGESFTTGSAANYTSALSCTGTSGLAGNTLTVGAADTNIVCTYTNTRKTANLTLQKTWVNALVGDTVNVTATGLTILNSVANTASETDVGGVQTVRAGDVITIGETFTVGSSANYTSVLSCTGNSTALAGNVLTVNSADSAITCTQTNTRKTATVTLRKTWVNATVNDAVNVTATGLTTLNSVANTANETDAGSAQTVRAGDAITIAEAFTVGTAANYTQILSCTGNTTPLSGNILTVNGADTAIVCTYTNTKKTATVTLQKTWVNALVNDAVSVTATGLTALASVATTPSKTDAGGAQSVFVGSVLTLGETFTTGSAANYTSVLSCTGTSGLAGNTLTVGASDTNIVCTYTNTRKTVNLTLRKTWMNAIVNDAANVTATELTTLNSVAISSNKTDAGGVQTVRTGDAITIGEAFTVGAGANYTQTLACTGTSGLSGNTLIVGSSDTAIVCTYTNTRKTATVTLQKTWVNATLNDAVNITATGLTTLSSVATTANKTDAESAQSVFVGSVLTLGETFTTGNAANYTTALVCTGTNGLSGNTLTVGVGDTAIVCTYTNTSNGVAVSGTVYSDANHNGIMDGGESGTGQSLYVKLLPRSGGTCSTPARASVSADPATGAYTIPSATSGDYCLILATNGDLNDPTPAWPGGWITTETPTGIRSITVAATPLSAQNFGIYHGSRLSGKVFSDTGVGGGTPNNGIQDGTEPGLGGVGVRVTDNGGGTTYDSTTTAGTGDYTFWIPAAAGSGPLKIVETNLSSYISTNGNAGTTGGGYDRASDTVTFTNIMGSSYTGVNFADVPGNTFAANSSKSVVAGGAVFHAHTFTAGTGGTITFSTGAVASPLIVPNWSEVLYRDTDCNGSLDAGEPQITAPVAAAAGQQICILVKEFAPANAPIGASNNVTVTAGFAYSNSSLPVANLTVTDLTSVMQSGLTLLKYVDKAAARPGDTLVYSITYSNTGSSPLTNVVINDNIPTFTNSPTACCVNPTTACLGSPPTSYPASLSGCTILTTSSAISWTLNGTLDPGASGQVKFSVKVDN